MKYTRGKLNDGRIDDEALKNLEDIYADALVNLGDKEEVIRILRQILTPDDIQSHTICPQCSKHFCNQSYWMLHVINRHYDIAM